MTLIKLRRKYTEYKIDGGGTPKTRKGGRAKAGNNPSNNPKAAKRRTILSYLMAAARARGIREDTHD